MPAKQQAKVLEAVVVDPTKAQIVKQIAVFKAKGLTKYGTLTHRVFWGPPIEGSNTANIGDCMDQDKSGVMDAKTRVKKTHGYARQDTRGVMVKGSDGNWRLRDLLYYNESTC